MNTIDFEFTTDMGITFRDALHLTDDELATLSEQVRREQHDGIQRERGDRDVQWCHGGRVTINSSSNGSTATVAKINGASAGGDYMVIQDSTATPTNHWFAGTHSTLVSNTSGWSLADPPPYVPPEVTMLW